MFKNQEASHDRGGNDDKTTGNDIYGNDIIPLFFLEKDITKYYKLETTRNHKTPQMRNHKISQIRNN